MKPQIPLVAKILTWLLLNLVILGVVGIALFQAQFSFGLDSLLAGSAGERLQSLGTAIAGQLDGRPLSDWSRILKSFSDAYNVDFLVFDAAGTQVAGKEVALPDVVASKVIERRGFGTGMGRGPPPGRGPRPVRENEPPAVVNKFLQKTGTPTQYWTGLRLLLADGDQRTRPYVLVIRSESLGAGGLLVDARPWALAASGALLFSILWWLPLGVSITRAVSRITRATEQIADGHFDVQIMHNRRDELGRLGNAINRMASRLETFVTGQKRFLGGVAHELCSPIARMQLALGILEERADGKEKLSVDDLKEEVQQMSSLVDELLSFSKAGLSGAEVRLQPVELLPVVHSVVARENSSRLEVSQEIPEGLLVLAERKLLSRGLANVLRNAIRYAGDAGPIEIRAASRGGFVEVAVRDHGPGVAPELIGRIFEPFFRVEESRSRDTGGVGLGLTIVKTCVEACDGTVRARNHPDGGLEVIISLKRSENTEPVAALQVWKGERV